MEAWVILYANPDKLERLREVLANHAAWCEQNEPDTLVWMFFDEEHQIPEFAKALHPDTGADKAQPKIYVFEKYKNTAAAEFHCTNDHFKQLLQDAQGEGLLLKPNDMFMIKTSGGFRR